MTSLVLRIFSMSNAIRLIYLVIHCEALPDKCTHDVISVESNICSEIFFHGRETLFKILCFEAR